MKQKNLGWTDLKITNIGLGTWAIGGGGWRFGWGPQDDKESILTIRRAIELGINWIDTAPIYGFGHSEIVVGKAIKGLKPKPIIATKCSRLWNERGEISGSLKRDSIKKEAEASLKRLNIEVIDLYQIHWPSPEEDIEEAWSAIAELIKEGKIRYGGVSNFSVEQMKHIQKIHPIASVQPPYSMLRREIEDGLLGYCSENNIGVIVYSPMQKGLLTGKITQERIKTFEEDDHRKRDPMFQEPELSKNLAFVNNLRPIAERKGLSLAQLAIAWTLRRDEVTAAIVGARHPQQIEETVIAGESELTREDINEITELIKKHKV